jgi:hypothetical protein
MTDKFRELLKDIIAAIGVVIFFWCFMILIIAI